MYTESFPKFTFPVVEVNVVVPLPTFTNPNEVSPMFTAFALFVIVPPFPK